MSHTTKLTSLSIKSEYGIENAVKNLIARGLDIELLEDVYPEMYYRKQATEIGRCDYVIRMAGSPYDVGLKRGRNGEYEIYFDEFLGSIKDVLGLNYNNPDWTDDQRRLSHIAQFTREYTLETIKKNHNDNGIYDVTISEIEGGKIQVVANNSEYA